MTSKLAAIAVVALAIPGIGCSYVANRVLDFGDCFRVEMSVGVGLQAHVDATDIAHVGLGSSRRFSGGWRYGEFVGERRIENDFPASYIETLINPEAESLHSLRWGPGNEGQAQHRCFGVVAGELNRDTWEKDPIHYFDVEVSVMAGIAGVQVGFSLGEFFDFLAGLVTLDPARDDGERRREKAYWRKVPAPIELSPHARP